MNEENDIIKNDLGKLEKKESAVIEGEALEEKNGLPVKKENGSEADSKGKEKKTILKGTTEKKWTVKKIMKTVALAAVVLLAWLAIVQYMAADKYEAVVKVVEQGGKIGVNPLTERLDFGDLPKGNSASRIINVENKGGMNIYVKIIKTGEISELIKISKNDFVLPPNSNEKVEFLLEMPISADKEGYKGNVMVFKLPKIF